MTAPATPPVPASDSVAQAVHHQVNVRAGLRAFVQTSDETPTVLTLDGEASVASNQPISMEDNTFVVLRILVVASNGTDTKAWTVDDLVLRATGAGSVAIVGGNAFVIIALTGGVSWAVTLAPNPVLGSIKVEVTGEAGETIDWRAHIERVTL